VHEHRLADGRIAHRHVLDEWHADHAAAWVANDRDLWREEIR
jgi:hypothetical protein